MLHGGALHCMGGQGSRITLHYEMGRGKGKEGGGGGGSLISEVQCKKLCHIILFYFRCHHPSLVLCTEYTYFMWSCTKGREKPGASYCAISFFFFLKNKIK